LIAFLRECVAVYIHDEAVMVRRAAVLAVMKLLKSDEIIYTVPDYDDFVTYSHTTV
jgi:vesicle coat complex subunit